MAERVQTDRFQRRALIKRAQSRYVSDKHGYAGQVTRVDVVLAYDPFSPQSMSGFDHLRAALAPSREKSDHLLPPQLNTDATKLDYLGGTPSIRDLKTVTNGDQWRIDILVPAVVFLILVILLRKIATSAYLIVTVFFSYLVTLGVTFTVFYLLDPPRVQRPRLEGADVPVHDPGGRRRGLQHPAHGADRRRTESSTEPSTASSSACAKRAASSPVAASSWRARSAR